VTDKKTFDDNFHQTVFRRGRRENFTGENFGQSLRRESSVEDPVLRSDEPLKTILIMKIISGGIPGMTYEKLTKMWKSSLSKNIAGGSSYRCSVFSSNCHFVECRFVNPL
jgi:hypothetical protein